MLNELPPLAEWLRRPLLYPLSRASWVRATGPARGLQGIIGIPAPGSNMWEDDFYMLSLDYGRLAVTWWSAEKIGIQSLQ